MAFSGGILALGMLLTNLFFEAIGSVSDFENCGFLAGNILAILIIFPSITFLIAHRTAVRISQRHYEEVLNPWIGKTVGLAGSLIYFLPGMGNLFAEGRVRSLSFELVATIVGLTVICTGFGHFGQLSALRKMRDNELINSFI